MDHSRLDYRFTTTHEWLHAVGEEAVVGITDHAQSQLGDVIFVDLPKVGRVVKSGERMGTIESVKAASDLYAPVAGTVSQVNTLLVSNPELVNKAPYGDGWIVKLSPFEADDHALLDEDGYLAQFSH